MKGIDQADFEAVFNHWYEPVRNYLYYLSGEPTAAEDITQDIFLKVWEMRQEIKLETLPNLIYTMAKNLFLNRQHHRQVMLRFIHNHEKAVNHESPDFVLETSEFDERLQAALSGLDEKLRVVFLMNRIDQFTYHQIADSLGITVKAVEKRMSKALAHLREEMKMKL